HAAGRDVAADLLGAEVPLPLGDALHLRRDNAQAGIFKLRAGRKAARVAHRAAGAVALREGDLLKAVVRRLAALEKRRSLRAVLLPGGPAVGQKVPRGLVADAGHARHIGRAEGVRAASAGGD